MLTSLFDEFERSETNRDSFQVERYNFLNTSAIPEAINARQVILTWSDGFPLTKEFLKRFRSNNNKQHTAALFELFIYHYFKSNGFAIQPLDRLSTPTPDFKIELGSESIYLECTCSSNSGIDETTDKLQSVILDSFKNIDKQKQFINIEWLVNSDQTPSLKRIRHFIREYINDTNRPHRMIIEDAGWKIQITLMPASPTVTRGIGLMFSPEGIVTPHLNVLIALNDKRPSKYKLTSPYIIAILSEDMYLNHLDMDLTLFDGARFQDKLPLKRGRENAFFIAGQHLTNSSVSAVLLVQRLNVYSDSRPKMMLYNHPEPKYPFDTEPFKMPQQQYKLIDEDNFQIIDVPDRSGKD